MEDFEKIYNPLSIVPDDVIAAIPCEGKPGLLPTHTDYSNSAKRYEFIASLHSVQANVLGEKSQETTKKVVGTVNPKTTNPTNPRKKNPNKTNPKTINPKTSKQKVSELKTSKPMINTRRDRMPDPVSRQVVI